MNGWLSPESKFYQAWSLSADLVILNLLTIICSLPIVTAGAAFAATSKICGDIAQEKEGYILRNWFTAFKENFRQATIVWVITAIFLGAFWWEVLLAGNLSHAQLAGIFTALPLCAIGLIVAFLSWYFPLITRFHNSLLSHISNALRLAIGKLPITFTAIFLIIFPVLSSFYLPALVKPLGIFMTIIGVAFIAYLIALLQKSTWDTLNASAN